MPAPGIISGSDSLSNLFDSATGEGFSISQSTGVFATNPGATPKYAFNRGRRDAEYRETMARLFIEVPESQVESVVNSVPENVRDLARVLISGGPSGGGGGTGFIDFLLTNVQESLQEKTQIVETLTDTYVAFYSGEQAPVFAYSGTVLNTYQDDQRVWLFQLYREILRGTRLANRGLFANLRYDSFIVSGYLENLGLTLRGDIDTAGDFTFQMRVKRMSVVTPILSYPTIVTSPASEESLLEDASRINAEVIARRPAVIAATSDSGTPPTAIRGPAAGGTPGEEDPEEAVDNALGRAVSDADVWDERLSNVLAVATERISGGSSALVDLTLERIRRVGARGPSDEAAVEAITRLEENYGISDGEAAARRELETPADAPPEVTTANPTAVEPVASYGRVAGPLRRL